MNDEDRPLLTLVSRPGDPTEPTISDLSYDGLNLVFVERPRDPLPDDFIDGEAHPLPPPFLVFATQNPLDFEGTYPLPEAQLDRFLLKVLVDYPGDAAEIDVLRRHHQGFRPQSLEDAGIQEVVSPEQLLDLQRQVQKITVEDKVFSYIYDIVKATRNSNDVLVGASPRAGIALLNCSKAIAALRGREFVIPDDVKELALPVLRHRVILRPEAEVEGLTIDRVLTGLLAAQPVPR